MADAWHDRYPGLKQAALEIAYDNGMIRRGHPEEEFLREVEALLAAKGEDLLSAASAWLDGLSKEDLNDVCCGESEDMGRLMDHAPAGTNDLLNLIFEGEE